MDNLIKLHQTALQYRKNSYSPYSKFSVGAVIVSETGNIYGGCNVENSSYPCGTCAEAGAISSMIANGDSKIKEIIIVADSENIIPCGNCLQKIAEFSDENTLVHSASLSGINKTFKLSELLPHHFKLNGDTNA